MRDYKKEIHHLRIENELLIRQVHSLQLQLVTNTGISSEYIPIVDTLPYQLGKTMINSSDNISSFFKLSKVLKRAVQQASFDDDYIENIATIEDLLNSKHLSYRLGLIYLKYNGSILSRSIRPWLLYKEVRKFRKEKAMVK